MRILLLAPEPFFSPRGTPLAERAVLEALSAAGHEVDVLTFAEGEDVDIAGCRIWRVPAIPGLGSIRPGFSVRKVVADLILFFMLIAHVRRRRPRVIHAVEESALMAMVVRALFGVPYVYDMDSRLSEQLVDRYRWLRPGRRALEAIERAAVRRSAGVIAVCEALAGFARDCAPSAVVACVEDVTLLRDDDGAPGAATEAGSPGLVLYVGNLEPYQGIDLLLTGFCRTLRTCAFAGLLIVGGTDDDIERKRGQAAALGIADRVTFVGTRPVEELGSWLRQAQVLVSPRLSGRNTPMKIYSYLDSMRPVVATRLPTHTQVLDDRIAVLVEPKPESLGDELAALLQDPARCNEIARRARAVARERYTPEVAAAKVRAFYRHLEEILPSTDSRK